MICTIAEVHWYFAYNALQVRSPMRDAVDAWLSAWPGSWSVSGDGQVFNADGTVAYVVGSEGSEPGQMRHPAGVAVDRDGRIVVCEYGNSRVQASSPCPRPIWSLTLHPCLIPTLPHAHCPILYAPSHLLSLHLVPHF